MSDNVLARGYVFVRGMKSRVLSFLSSCLITLTIFGFGITAKGDWVLLGVHLLRQFGVLQEANNQIGPIQTDEPFPSYGISLESFYLNGVFMVWTICVGFGFVIYFVTGGILHWYFYVKQREKPEVWKCQPHKWLSSELQVDAILCGSRSLLLTSTVTSLLATYIANGGWSTVYYRFDEYSWLWYILQYLVVFCYQDYTMYLVHRWFHTPWLYKKFHKAHHKYVQPTAFTVTALHPVEILTMQLALCVPLFVLPVHWTSFSVIALYTYYNGIIDHSGINFTAPWWEFWKPDTMFHDNHHQYFHVNFGFNCYFWDKLHGTYRRPDRIYKESIFYGRGKPLSEASAEELDNEVKERLSENRPPHRLMNPYLNEVLDFKETILK